MKTKLLLLGIFTAFAILIFYTCKKDEGIKSDYPRITTFDVSNIDSTGADFSGEITSEGKEEILDYGFVWGLSTVDLSYCDYVSLGKWDKLKQVHYRINQLLETKKQYIVRSYIKTATYTVYGKEIKFMSLGSQAPKILGFWPDSAHLGETIYIKCKNISRLTNENIFTIGNVNNYTKIVNDSVLATSVPPNLDSLYVNLKVSVCGNSNLFAKKLKIITPQILSISSNHGYWGKGISIQGKGFSYPGYSDIKINGTLVQGYTYGDTLIDFAIPDNISQVESKITVGPFNVPYFKFIIDKPQLTLTSPEDIAVPSTIQFSIKGAKKEYTKLFFNDIEFNTYWNNLNQFSINLSNYQNGTYPIYAVVMGQKSNIVYITISKPSFTTNGTFQLNLDETLSIVGDNLKLITKIVGNSNMGISYDVPIIEKTNTQIKVKPPNTLRYKENINLTLQSSNVGFLSSINMVLNDPVINTIAPQTIIGNGGNFTLTGTNFNNYVKPTISINGIICSVTSFNLNSITVNALNIPQSSSNFLEYSHNGYYEKFDLATKGINVRSPWSIKSLPPSENYENNYNSFGGFSLNNNGYVLRSGILYKYDPNSDKWQTVNQDFKNEYTCFHLISNNKYGYFLPAYSSYSYFRTLSTQITEYNPNTNSYSKLCDLPSDVTLGVAISFFLDNKLYFIARQNTSEVSNIKSMYCYNFIENKIEKKASFPDIIPNYIPSSFVKDGKAYVLTNNVLKKYDPETDKWSYISNFSNYGVIMFGGTFDNGLSYMLFNNYVQNYDIENNRWNTKSKLPFSSENYRNARQTYFFNLNNKLYLSNFYDYFYEYDPSLDNL